MKTAQHKVYLYKYAIISRRYSAFHVARQFKYVTDWALALNGLAISHTSKVPTSQP